MRGKLMFGAASAALLAFAFTAPAAAQEADPAADASTQARLTLDQPVNGAIDPAGDGDWYRLSVSQGQRYTITLNAAQSEGEGALDPMLGLYDSSGEQIGFNDDAGGTLNSQLSFAPSASGEVFIEARAFADASTGAYTLAASATVLPPDDAGNDAGTRARIRAGQPVNGALEYEGDADWYRFEARSGYSYRVTLVGAEGAETPLGDPLLMVMNDAGDQIAYNDDDDGLNSGLDFTVNRSGRVFIVAGAFADAYAGAYTLNVESTRLPPDPASADIYTRARVNAGQSVEGAIDYAGDRDWHRIRLTAGQTYRFALSSTGESPLSDPYLRLYNARGDEVAADDDGGGDLNALLEYTAEATGNYFVEAGAFADSGTGGYTLQAREGDIPGDASTDMRLAPEGDYREGVLSPAGDRDWYRLDLNEGDAVRIALSSIVMDDYDPMIVLYDAAGQEITRDDDGGEGLNSWLEFQARASGAYYVEVRGFGEDSQGRYALMLSPGEISDSADTNEMLATNGDGRFSTIGEVGDVDWFAIDLVEGRAYRFAAEGAGETPLADPMLTLYDATGQEVAADDDGGPGANPYLSFASPTGGPHFLAVSGFGDSTGGYYVRGLDTDVPGHIYTDELLDAANGDERASRIDIPGDLDYFRVELEAGVRYEVRISGQGPHALARPAVRLMDEENNSVANGSGRTPSLRFTPSESGFYYVQASGLGGATGSYQVSIVRR